VFVLLKAYLRDASMRAVRWSSRVLDSFSAECRNYPGISGNEFTECDAALGFRDISLLRGCVARIGWWTD
jgi:hypothetical protein